jgi:5'-nucleotidase
VSEALRKVVILHTNDIHSHFEQMPRIAAVMHELTMKHGSERVITVDCGDHMDRMRMETEGTYGQANVGIMNRTGYDIITLGNNEGLTFSREELEYAYGNHAEFVVICGNLFDADTGEQPGWLNPYHVVEKEGLRIGFIAVTAYYIDFYKLLGWDIREPFEVVSYWVGILREQVDVLIVLSHLGLGHDQRLAQEIKGIDLILGGHTHHLLEQPLHVGDTYICATGKFGQYVGEVEITYDILQNTVIEVYGRCVPVNEYPSNEAIVQLIQQYKSISSNELNQVVTAIEQPLAIDWYGESDFGNLLAAGIRKWVNADIGIVNAGQILQSLREGKITREHLLHLCPSPINPCHMLLEGRLIHFALEESLLLEFQEKPIQGYGFRGRVLGALCTDGLNVEYDPHAEAYHKIKQIWVKGDLLQPDQVYRVGTIDMFTFGVGYLTLKQGREIEFALPEFLRDLLVKELKDAAAMVKCRERHWIVT